MFKVGDTVRVKLTNPFGKVLLETVSPILATRRDPILLRDEFQVQLNEIQTGWVERSSLEGVNDDQSQA